MTASFNGAYFQNFDTLANTGTSNTWTDNSTLPGWYSTRSSYTTAGGGINISTEGLYSFGNGNSTDRALGSMAGTNTGNINYGVRLVNNSGEAINVLRVEYTGEQWRNGGNTSRQKLNFSYQMGSNLTSLTSGNWTSVTALDFTGPVASSTASSLLGTSAGNQSLRYYFIKAHKQFIPVLI